MPDALPALSEEGWCDNTQCGAPLTEDEIEAGVTLCFGCMGEAEHDHDGMED